MVDSRFYKNLGPHKLSKIIEYLDSSIEKLDIPQDIVIQNIKPLDIASNSDISFLANYKYNDLLKTTKAAVIIVPKDLTLETNHQAILLRSQNPYFAYSKLTQYFYKSAFDYSALISESAQIAASATIGKNCYIGHNVVIEDNVVVGDNSIIKAGSFIDAGVTIGKNNCIYSNVSISYSIIGDNNVIFPGAKIGQDGFGFATEKGEHHKIFHTGLVRIGNNVEIGANTTIDRGSSGDTVIEDLCRIDNLVQIGHNVKIGKGSIIVAQVGIAGSSIIGKYCALGGQVGVAGHLNIGDYSQVAGQGGVTADIEPKAIVGGTPAIAIKEWHRQSIIMKRLLQKEKVNDN